MFEFPNYYAIFRTILSRYKRFALGEVLGNEVPVDQVPERLDVLRTGVTVVDVVRVFPHIAGQQRLRVGRQRRGGVGGRHQIQRAVGLLHQPGPARTERADSRLGELFLELVEAAPLGVDGVSQRAGRALPPCGFRPFQ